MLLSWSCGSTAAEPRQRLSGAKALTSAFPCPACNGCYILSTLVLPSIMSPSRPHIAPISVGLSCLARELCPGFRGLKHGGGVRDQTGHGDEMGCGKDITGVITPGVVATGPTLPRHCPGKERHKPRVQLVSTHF